MRSEVDHLPADASLAELIRDGDRSAEARLVARFYRRVVLIAWARTRDQEAAADLAQETMLAVLQALRDGKLVHPSRLAGFVRGTAKNLINNNLRGLKTARQRPASLPRHPGPDPEQLAGGAERINRVRRALADLGPDDRMVRISVRCRSRWPGPPTASRPSSSLVIAYTCGSSRRASPLFWS